MLFLRYGWVGVGGADTYLGDLPQGVGRGNSMAMAWKMRMGGRKIDSAGFDRKKVEK